MTQQQDCSRSGVVCCTCDAPLDGLHTVDCSVDAHARSMEERRAASLPDDNPKTAFGVQKPPLHHIPPTALLHLGKAMENGAGKYGLMNWREKHVSASVYYDSAFRHLMAYWDGEDRAADSGLAHLAHAMACCAILLDAEATGNLNDDRPAKGVTAQLIESMISR